jgi:hypothetical protein
MTLGMAWYCILTEFVGLIALSPASGSGIFESTESNSTLTHIKSPTPYLFPVLSVQPCSQWPYTHNFVNPPKHLLSLGPYGNRIRNARMAGSCV